MFSSSFFTAYHRWNALLCVPIGFVLNFLLLWLILRRTPKDMWVHSRVLLQTCILDILMLIVLAMGGHMMAGIQSQYNLVMFQGYFLDLYQKLWGVDQQNGLQLLMQLSFGIYHLDTQSISVQFLYRYLFLNHGIKIGIGRYLLFLLPALLFKALYGTLPFMFNRDEDFASLEKDLFINHGIIEFGQKPPYYVVYQQKDSFSKLWGTLFVLSQTFFYIIILFCGIRMVRFVSAHAMTERLKELNRQLSRNLIILATYPLIMDMSLALFVAVFGLISTESSSLSLDLQLLMSPLINWFSVFNPLISIWTFKPYRETILKAICFCNFKIVPALN